MIILFDYCSIPWWLLWIPTFLLGLALGWLIWAKYKKRTEELEKSVLELENKILGLQVELESCKKTRMEAEGNISLLRGRMREMESSIGTKGAVAVVAGIAKTKSSKVSASKPKAKPLSSIGTDKFFAAVGTDKLQILEGIGPKMEEVLKENGISNFTTLASTSKENLREILDKYGEKYRIIDPNTWPQQASMAYDKDWKGLISLQKSLDGGRSDTLGGNPTDSKLEKYLVRVKVIRRWKLNDLKAIEGINPKIEKLLHEDGINTWSKLSETSTDHIQDILDKAGSRYQLADPSTWPRQAQLAADGLWDDLQKYQDELQAGREK
jgi:predicted flap endonuclease-1-like 5' DNA nuclease